MHDASKVLMGATTSSAKDITNNDSDPATFLAGLAVRQKNDGKLSVAKSDGMHLGISLGKSLSDHKKTAIARTGEGVPLRLTESFESLVVGDLTFTAKNKGNLGITITLADTVTAGSEAASVANDTDITVAIEGGVSTAAQIKAAVEADEEANALVSVTIAEGESASAQAAAAEDALEGGLQGSDYVVLGAKAYINDTTGLADQSGSGRTISDATYVSAPLTGIAEDGSEVAVALVDMPGGL